MLKDCVIWCVLWLNPPLVNTHLPQGSREILLLINCLDSTGRTHNGDIGMKGFVLDEDAMIWKRLPHYWPFVGVIHWPPIDFPQKMPVIRASDVL